MTLAGWEHDGDDDCLRAGCKPVYPGEYAAQVMCGCGYPYESDHPAHPGQARPA